MAKINARFMETNMKYMSHSMRPTLYTFIPILLVFGWLSSHFAYYPLEPGKAFLVTAEFNDDAIGRVKIVPPIEFDIIQDNQEQDVDKVVAWRLISYTPGNFTINVLYKEREYPIDVIITTGKEYATVEKDFRKSFLFFSTSDENGLDRLKLGNEKILPFSTVPVIKDIPWVGGWGWFGVYIFFSLIFSMGLRKIFNVY